MPPATPSRQAIEAIAEHCFGLDPDGRRYPFTRLTKGKLWDDNGDFIVNRDGHLPDGSVVSVTGHDRAYRLRLVSTFRASEDRNAA